MASTSHLDGSNHGRGGRGFAAVAVTRPACCVFTAVGVLLVAGSVEALIPSRAAFTSGQHHRRPGVRGRATSELRCSASEAEHTDSSEIYAAMRRRLEELKAARGRTSTDAGSLDEQRAFEELSDGPGSCMLAYSGQEMKKAYYAAFWRARNLKKDAQDIDEASSDNNAPSVDPGPPPASSARLQQPATLLTTTAMDMILSKYAEEEGSTASAAPEAVQGLTQMYYLDEKDELEATCMASATPVLSRNGETGITDVATTVPNAGLFAFEELDCWPVGLSQMFFVEDAHEEAAAAARALPLANRSFLREKLGVPGEVVQDLRQVELDHARLAMLAVLLSVAVGAGAGVPASADFVDAHVGLAALAQVARTPWLDPCVAGAILAVKALSEGDWRLGKGALAGWADKSLRLASDVGAKVLRLGTGDEMRKLAVEMEVRHGRLALGAVVCAMAQQGIMTVVA